ncbi:hypothetical protein [Catenuloplanes japonicus]|uniref:hypothetical protein n=1 Tax=Catenuloplanes japonicus TaxID=33876 RepID=UPI0012FBE723|nr:hypothetical protein [Catenuloplanes japonicus]
MGHIDRVRAARDTCDGMVAEALAGLFESMAGALRAGVSAADIAAASRFDVDQVTRIGVAANILAPAPGVEPDDRAAPQWRETLAATDDPRQRARLERLPRDSRPLPTVDKYDALLARRGRADGGSGGMPAP